MKTEFSVNNFKQKTDKVKASFVLEEESVNNYLDEKIRASVQ